MFFLNKRKMLHGTLGFRYIDPQGTAWRLKDESFIQAAMNIKSIIEDCNKNNPNLDIDIIKQEDNRLVYRIRVSAAAEKTYIVKVFPLLCLRHRLKYHLMKYTHNRFAFGEAVGLILASKAGLKVPEVYGYGCVYGWPGIITSSAVILEDLANHKSVGDLLKLHRDNEAKCKEVIDRAIPLFIDVYKAACNIINFNVGAIMLSNDRLQHDDYILDFEYARFYEKPSLELLMFEAATFCKYCRHYISETTMNDWLSKVLDALPIHDNSMRSKLTERFQYYRNTDLSRKKREKIGIS